MAESPAPRDQRVIALRKWLMEQNRYWLRQLELTRDPMSLVRIRGIVSQNTAMREELRRVTRGSQPGAKTTCCHGNVAGACVYCDTDVFRESQKP